MKQTTEPNQTTRKHGKRALLILSAAALALILAVTGLLVFLASGLGNPGRSRQSLETYLAESWTVFRLRSWDADTGALELDYPLRFTYAQMEKYGGSLEELQALPTGNLDTVASLKLAAREAAGATIRAVTVYGLTSDGLVAYTVYPDGTVTACWTTEGGSE